MGAVDSPNLYAFVGWGPHMGTDPMGLDSTLVDWRGGVPVWLEDDEVKVTPDDQSNGEIVETSDDQDDPSGSPSDAGDIMERLDRQPKEATMNDVLKSGFVDPHLPCVDSFSARYNESWEQLTTGLNSEMSHQLGYIGEAMTNMPGLPINMPVIGEALTAPEGVPGWPYSHSVARFTINATNVTPTIARLRGSHTIFGMLTGAGPSGIGKLPAMRAAIGTSLLAGPATYATYEAAIRVGTVINVQISDCKRIAPEGEGM